MHPELSPRALTGAVALAVLTLAGCGGGGGDGGSAPAPTTQSMTGVVIDGAIQGATVCLDLNRNDSCDSGEPVSGASDAQGRYTISGLSAEQAASGAPLVAVVPVGAVDAVNGPVTTAYTMLAPAGKPEVISPITHLVQAGVAGGMSLTTAEATVAQQLQVQATSVYNNYTTSSSGDNAALAAVVPTLVAGLQAGERVDVSAPATSAPGYHVRTLNFTNASNYFLRYYSSDNVASSTTGLFTWYDRRTGLTSGAPTADNALYDDALHATAQGWITHNGSTANTSTHGSPNISNWGIGFSYVSMRTDVDVSGLPIADVVRMAQDMNVNTVSTLLGVDPSTLSGTMPAGARVRRNTAIETASPVSYRESDGFVGLGVTTLAGMVATFPVPTATVGTSNSVSLGGLHGTAGCGTTVCPQERLRAAFGSGNAVTYYLCDINFSTNVQSNCTVQGTGTYATSVAADGATPIMTFAGLPASAAIQAFTRVFVQRNGHVYFGFKNKFITTKQTRLNKVAFEALAAVLGVTPPTIGDSAPTASPFAGTWSASYTGSDSGNCSALAVASNGTISGSCVSTGVGGSFGIVGTVASNGSINFSTTTSGGSFTGTLGTASGSGSWTWPSLSGSGSWTATKL